MPVRVYDADDGRVILTLGGRVPVNSLGYRPDGRTIAAGGPDRTIHIWDAMDGKERHKLVGRDATANIRGHEAVQSLAYSHDGKRLAAAEQNGPVRIWDLDSGEERLRPGEEKGFTERNRDGTLTFHATRQVHASAVAFSSDGARIASGGFEGIGLCDARDGRRLGVIPLPDGGITGLAFSPDGRELAAACVDATIRVWDAEERRPRLVLAGHGSRVTGVAYSPDGRRIASANEGGTIRLWDTAGGDAVLTLKGHDRPVTGVVFSPDGHRILSADDAEAIKVWDATPIDARRRQAPPRGGGGT
jgi:WD40 repeat protein